MRPMTSWITAAAVLTDSAAVEEIEAAISTQERSRSRSKSVVAFVIDTKDKWVLGGTVPGVALIGLRVAAGEKHGKELTRLGQLFVAIAAVVVAVVVG
jgi:hypothetical protein